MIDAESALRREDYPETVNYSQEAVGISLKSGKYVYKISKTYTRVYGKS